MQIGTLAQLTLANEMSMRGRWDGLRWWVVLPCGSTLPVEASFVKTVGVIVDTKPSGWDRFKAAMLAQLCRLLGT